VIAAAVRKHLRFDKKLGFTLVLLTRRILLEARTWSGQFNGEV
jgi:hypothetical protein